MSIQQIRKSILIVAGIGAIAAAGLFAGRLSAGAFPHSGRGDFVPRVFARVARALDLTEDQKEKIKEVLRAHAEEIKAQMRASAAACRNLHALEMAQPADESAIRAAAAEVGRVRGEGALLFARVHSEIAPILTPEQREKVQTFRGRAERRAIAAERSLDRFLRNDS